MLMPSNDMFEMMGLLNSVVFSAAVKLSGGK